MDIQCDQIRVRAELADTEQKPGQQQRDSASGAEISRAMTALELRLKRYIDIQLQNLSKQKRP